MISIQNLDGNVKIFVILFFVANAFAQNPTILLYNIDHSKDPELGVHFSRSIDENLNAHQKITLTSALEVYQYSQNEALQLKTDKKAILSHFHSIDSLDYVIDIKLNRYDVTKERQDYILVTGQQHASQSAYLIITDGQNKTLYTGTLMADSTIATGYCGIFNCTQENLPVKKQINIHTSVLKSLSSKIVDKISQLIPLN